MIKEKLDQCVILLAGKGTRFLPASKVVAKELFPIENKPALLYHLSDIYKSGIKRVCLVISKEKEYIKKFVTHNEKMEEDLRKNGKLHLLDELNNLIDNMQIDFVYQEELNGTGGAVQTVQEWTKNKPFVLMYGDDLTKSSAGKPPVVKQIMTAFEKTGKCVVAVKSMPTEKVSLYSSIITKRQIFDRCYEMEGIEEKPKIPPSNLIGLSPFVLTSEIFEAISKCQSSSTGEIYLTDALNLLAQQNKVVCYDFNAKYYDCGNKLEYTKCIIDFALQDDEISDKLKAYLKTINCDENC